MFNSLIHGEDLFEILIEGTHPYAQGSLSEAEQALLRTEGVDVANLEALAIGRVVMGGRGVWTLSPSHMVLLGQSGRASIDRVPRADITHAERETGRYGDTVRLQTAQGRWAMYGVDPSRAAQLLERLNVAASANV